MRPIPVARIVCLVFDFACWDTERNGFIRFGSDLNRRQQLPIRDKQRTHDKILERLVGRLLSLLPCTHKPPAREHVGLDLWQVNLYHHALFSGIVVSDFSDAVTWPANFEEDLPLDSARGGRDHQLGVFGIPCGTAGQVSLMLFALGVSQVGAFVCV